MANEAPKPESVPTKPTEPAKEPATPGKAEKPGFLDKLKAAWEEIHKPENEEKGWMERAGIFVMSFFKDMNELSEEEKQAAAEAEKEVKKTVDETVKSAQESAKPSTPFEGDDDKKLYETVYEIGGKSLKKLDDDREKSAHTGLAKLTSSIEGKEPSKLTIDEACALAGVGFMTFNSLKKLYPKKEDFKKALGRFSHVSASSKFPLSKLLSKSVLGIFKIDLEVSDYYDAVKLLSGFGIGITDVPTVYSTIKSIGKEKLEPAEETEIVSGMKQFFFPSTSEGDIASAVKIMRNLKFSGAAEIDTQALTDLLFYINDSDHDRLVAVLTGVKSSDEEQQMAEAA